MKWSIAKLLFHFYTVKYVERFISNKATAELLLILSSNFGLKTEIGLVHSLFIQRKNAAQKRWWKNPVKLKIFDFHSSYFWIWKHKASGHKLQLELVKTQFKIPAKKQLTIDV